MSQQPPKRIAFIETDPGAAELYFGALAELGYIIARLAYGPEVRDQLRRFDPDLVLLDIGERDGVGNDDLCALGREAPLIVITPLDETDRPEPVRRDPGNVRRWIFKPCRARTFLEAVDDVLCDH